MTRVRARWADLVAPVLDGQRRAPSLRCVDCGADEAPNPESTMNRYPPLCLRCYAARERS